MPKVSVIVPVYVVEKYIERCARSLFEQTLDDIEYLFIDDCTPDRSIDILRSVLEEYPNRRSQVIIHRMEQNSGQAAVRKWGILNATGDYVIHCDSDDWVEEEMLEKLYHRAKINNIDILFCDYYDERGGIVKYVENQISLDAIETVNLFISGKTKASLCMSLVKKSLYGNNSFSFPQFDMTEDMTSLVQLTYLAVNIGHIKEAFYHYCYTPSSITTDISESKCLKRYFDQKGNFELLWKFFEQVKCDKFVEIMKTKQFELRFALLPAIHHLKIYKLFVFGEGGYFRYLFADNALFRNKIITIVTVLGMHPMFSTIKRLVI